MGKSMFCTSVARQIPKTIYLLCVSPYEQVYIHYTKIRLCWICHGAVNENKEWVLLRWKQSMDFKRTKPRKIKTSVKHNHRLYKLSLRISNTNIIDKYKKYKCILQVCIKQAETNYYQTLFSNTQSSMYKFMEKYWSSSIQTKKGK